MLSREDNELLTRTGDGTSMGDFMRRFWMPVMLADELTEPDGAPVRVRLLGEDLIAFRDTEGRIGLVDRYGPHRRANLFFGRNEEAASAASITAGSSTSTAIVPSFPQNRPTAVSVRRYV